MKRVWLFGLSLVSRAALTNPPSSKYRPVSAGAADAIRRKSVQLLVMPTPKFVHFTGGDQAAMTVGMMFGALGGGIGAAAVLSHAQSEGQALVLENGIPDPTQELTEKIRNMLVTKYGSSIGDSSYAVTIATDSWALTKDTVVFNASVKLTDGKPTAAKSVPIAIGECRYRSPDEKDRPSADELLANHAEKLKQELSGALAHCVEDFQQKLFL